MISRKIPASPRVSASFGDLENRIRIEYTSDMARTSLRTIRFSPEELKEIRAYLRENPFFDSLSSLGRVAVREFIHSREAVPLRPVQSELRPRPSFLWDYDLSEAQVQEILHHAPFEEQKWLIARILERAPFREVFRYLTLQKIRKTLPSLRMDPKVKRHWQEALEVWSARTA